MLGLKIKDLRIRKGLTQMELSQALGVSSQAISKWERCISAPDISLLVPISDFFGVSIDYLLRENENYISTDYSDCVEIHVDKMGDIHKVHIKNTSNRMVDKVTIKGYFVSKSEYIIDSCEKTVSNLEPGMTKVTLLTSVESGNATKVRTEIKECVISD